MFRPLKYTGLLVYILICLPLIAATQTKSTNIQVIDGKKYYVHKIEKSQSLYAISKLYSVSLEEIYSLNPEVKAKVKMGQEIKIPLNALNAVAETNVSPTPTLSIDTNKYFTHKVLKGETVYSLIKKFNLSENQLNAYNPTLAQGLKEGQIIITGEKHKKKNNNREHREKEREKEQRPAVIVKDMKPNAPAVDSSLLKPVSKPKKPSYNVALILPFKLESTINMDLAELTKTKSNFPEVPALALDFYLGFKKSLDSLVTNEFDIHLELYDIDDKDSIKIIELVSGQKFKELDFIFGPLFANGFKTIAKKAKELHIPIVSPTAQQNKILYNNIYVSKTNPSQFTLLETLADYCLDSLKNSGGPILVTFSDKDKKESQFTAAFKKYYNDKLKQSGRSLKDSAVVVKSIQGAKPLLTSGSRNLVISLSSNPVLMTDFITQLSLLNEKKTITLCGWQNISEQENIDQEYLNQLNFTFAGQYDITGTAAYKSIQDWYRNEQGAWPGEYFYMGFDIARYYLLHLREQGPDFIYRLNSLNMQGNYLKFVFTRPDNSTGFDNRGAYIFKYNNYKILKTGWQ